MLEQVNQQEDWIILRVQPPNGVTIFPARQACMPAVNLALDDVNREKNLLPGFTLKLHSNDSEVRQ